MGISDDESANLSQEFEIIIVEPTVADSCKDVYLDTVDTTSYNDTSRYDVEYHIPAKGEPDYVAVIPALGIYSNKDSDDCPYVTIAQWNNLGVW